MGGDVVSRCGTGASGPCRVCGGPPEPDFFFKAARRPGRRRGDLLELYLALTATWRTTIGGARDWICLSCQGWVAGVMGLIQPPSRELVLELQYCGESVKDVVREACLAAGAVPSTIRVTS